MGLSESIVFKTYERLIDMSRKRGTPVVSINEIHHQIGVPGVDCMTVVEALVKHGALAKRGQTEYAVVNDMIKSNTIKESIKKSKKIDLAKTVNASPYGLSEGAYRVRALLEDEDTGRDEFGEYAEKEEKPESEVKSIEDLPAYDNEESDDLPKEIPAYNDNGETVGDEAEYSPVDMTTIYEPLSASVKQEDSVELELNYSLQSNDEAVMFLDQLKVALFDNGVEDVVITLSSYAPMTFKVTGSPEEVSRVEFNINSALNKLLGELTDVSKLSVKKERSSSLAV